MSDNINDGGPAFPVPEAFYLGADELFSSECRGMSLRDWFAGQALIALYQTDRSDFSTRQDADQAYRIADAMLAAKDNTPDRP